MSSDGGRPERAPEAERAQGMPGGGSRQPGEEKLTSWQVHPR